VKPAAAMEVGDLNKVWEVRALKTKPEAAFARELLDRVARQVQPIMRRHKWRVKVLSEFS
jgi:DNA-dependent metalloprotease WSS1